MTRADAGSLAAPRSPDEAIAVLLAHATPVSTERIGLTDAAGRVLAEPVLADRPSPAVDVSSMDGYAVRVADLGSGRLPIAGEVRIGREAPVLAPGAALRIVTGAPIPAGADAVIKREEVREHPDHIELSIPPGVRPGANIRRRAENIDAGGEVIAGGRVVSPPVAAALASFGYPRPLVHCRVRVGILTTGDEVLAVGSRDGDAAPTPWQLRDSNGASLYTLLSGRPWLLPLSAHHVDDDRDALRDAVAELLGMSDLLLLTGGVSMGTRDFVPGVLGDLGAEILFHKVPQRPGKPVLGAVSRTGTPILALPGNPVSVMVTARRMAGPVLERLAGLGAPATRARPVRVENSDGKRLELWWQRPVRLIGPSAAEIIPGMGSGDIVAAARSDGFVEIPPNESGPGPWPFYSWSL